MRKFQEEGECMIYLRPEFGKALKKGESLQPQEEVAGFKVRPGFYRTPGANQAGYGVSFTISSFYATGVTLLLFHQYEREPYARIPFPPSYKLGNTWSMIVYGLDIEEFEYAYSFDGPYDPSTGQRFDKTKIILDPYSKAVTEQREWGHKFENDYVYKARVVENNFDWGSHPQSKENIEDLIIYELHVRGFTKHESSGVRAPGTFEGVREKIPYLKELGVNAVELMPIFEFDEMDYDRIVDGRQLMDYWGYNTVCFFAPNTSYSSVQEHNHEGDELKRMIRELHDNNIEVILDVVFNHTAEGNEDGPQFSFKGIDNKIFYMLTPDGYYFNFSGCGNTVNCNHPIVIKFIIDCLRYWAVEYRIDGFRFDLASILTRDQNGAPMERPPLLEYISFDPILSNVKLIAEAWDAGGLYQVGSFPSWSRWSEWNGRYRDDMRCFLKGDEGMAGAAMARITGSLDMYSGSARNHAASVNFITCHDGFTLYDLYSYSMKHNEMNGWNNGDGDNNSHSWNCGAEGETEDPTVNALRRRLCKNAFAVLMCSRGPAMFFAGDEFCNTQFGNNNAYCQDNEISWLDWTRKDKFKEVYNFARFMINFRRWHPVLRHKTKPAECGYPDVSIHNGYPWNAGADSATRQVGVMYAGRNSNDTLDDIIYVGINTFWEERTVQIPPAPEGYIWRVLADTNQPVAPLFDRAMSVGECSLSMGPRSIVIAVIEKTKETASPEPTSVGRDDDIWYAEPGDVY